MKEAMNMIKGFEEKKNNNKNNRIIALFDSPQTMGPENIETDS